MKPKDFISTLQRKVSFTAVGPSAVRGQGKGVLRALRRASTMARAKELNAGYQEIDFSPAAIIVDDL